MRRTQEQIRQEMEQFKVYQKDGRWYGHRECPECKKDIEQNAQCKSVLIRNIRRSCVKNIVCLICSKTGVNNPFYGKHHSKESKKQNSKNRKGKACGKNNAMANPIYRNKISNILKKKYQNGELDFLKDIQRKNAYINQANGKLNTTPISKAEKEIINTLKQSGFDIEGQFKIDNLKYDILIKDKNIIIEYNGDYWHCNPKKYKEYYFNQKKQKYAYELWEQDKAKKELAEKNGYKLFIIWESDYMFQKEKTIEHIKQIINE
jgi:G:T-mismatch repair DNA endonuclease (very short patch repair protein)